MSEHVTPPLVLIPESAPFSADQRSWLSGYFAALLGPAVEGATAIGADAMPGGGPKLADNDDAPWHDPSLPIAERMEMAKARPEPQKFMAAMAQQDCGQCGYNCADYANAIFLKSEARLNLCQPGGKETLRMLKKLDEEFGAGTGAAPAAAPARPLRRRRPISDRWAIAAKIPSRRSSSAAVGSTSRGARRRRGTSSSTCGTRRSSTRSATRSACFPPTRRRSPTR